MGKIWEKARCGLPVAGFCEKAPPNQTTTLKQKDRRMIDATIRTFDNKKDMPGAVQCFSEGFEHILWPIIRHARPSLQKDLVTFFYKMSTDCYVAEADHRICGIIFGAAPFRLKKLINALIFYLLCVLPKGLINVYGMNRLAYKHFFQLTVGFVPYFFYHPHRWPMCEVTLFTSIKKHRGRGLGRRLMDRFVDTVRSRNHEGTFVCTDTALSYRFYEIYGFEPVKSFKQRSYKYSIPDRSFTSLIYYFGK